MIRLGFFGGTFDPIHFGHLECALRAYEDLGLDKVLVVPAGNPSFKRDCEIADAEDRLAMCCLACEGNSAFEVSEIEIGREGVTYSVDTISRLIDMLPQDAQMFFVIGSDAYLTLPKWRDAQRLVSLVTFAVLMRPGDDESAVLRIGEDCGADAVLVECPKLEISSSYLRDAVRRGRSIRYLVPDSVCDYIERRGLYAN